MQPDRTRTLFLVVHRAEVGFDSYHAVVMQDGTVAQQHPWDAHGDAVRNFNSVAVSVAFQGDFAAGDRAKYGVPTPEQLAAGETLFVMLRKRYPEAKISGHSCPGERFPLASFRQGVEDTLAAMALV
jgi:hypothetical protein